MQRCQRETSSTEFADWQRFFEQDLTFPRREEYYLAQIAAEVRRTIAKDPKAVAASEFLLKFDARGKAREATDEEVTDEDHEASLARSKAAWLAIVKAPVRPPP